MSDLGPFTGIGCAFTAIITLSIFGGAAGFAMFWFVVRPLVF